MKQYLKKILYGDTTIKEYASITTTSISEKVLLKFDHTVIDVSDNHWALCLQPVIFGIWINKSINLSRADTRNCVLCIEEKSSKKKLAQIKLSYYDSIHEKDGTLFLLKAGRFRLFHTSFLEIFFLYNRYYRKPKFSFTKFKSYVSVFSYPRKVRIVSFKRDGYYNIFPMDFAGRTRESKHYLFGLRHSNHALGEIIKSKKLLVSEVPFTHKDNIYELGSHHSSEPPPMPQLSFKTFDSKNFGFPVPDFAEQYNEINITRTVNLGSHMLLWGESQYEEIRSNAQGSLFHIHFLLDLVLQRHGTAYNRI